MTRRGIIPLRHTMAIENQCRAHANGAFLSSPPIYSVAMPAKREHWPPTMIYQMYAKVKHVQWSRWYQSRVSRTKWWRGAVKTNRANDFIFLWLILFRASIFRHFHIDCLYFISFIYRRYRHWLFYVGFTEVSQSNTHGDMISISLHVGLRL